MTDKILNLLEAIEELRKKLDGDLLQPGDEGYDEARLIWNGMINKRPALIARCKSTADVINAVNFARTHKLVISIKAGGHNVTGNAVCDDGLMIDLSLMRKVVVEPESRIAISEAGATWGDFDRATQEHGLATTGGLISSTGVAGLTIGGGVGWLVRKHGLSCDNLLEAEIVTADGLRLVANTSQHAELFWGIRGGAGNFGVVTSMKFQLHPVDTILGGMIIHPQDKSREVLQFYREFMKTAPEELTLYASMLTTPDGVPAIALIGCYCGDLEKGESALKELRSFGQPLVDLMQPMPYTLLQTMLDPAFPHGNRFYWKSCFLKSLSDEAIDTIISNVKEVPSPISAAILELYGGAASREPNGGAAYPHRQNEFDLVIISHWVNKEDDEKNISWARKLYDDMQEFSSHRVYVNLLGIEGEERIKEAFGKNYQRLSDLKAIYDPENLFRMNQNISK